MRALPIEKPAEKPSPLLSRPTSAKKPRKISIRNTNVSNLAKRIQNYAQDNRKNYSDADVVNLIEAARGTILAIHYQRKKRTQHKSTHRTKKLPPKSR